MSEKVIHWARLCFGGRVMRWHTIANRKALIAPCGTDLLSARTQFQDFPHSTLPPEGKVCRLCAKKAAE
jgi:hypothetical protein